MSGSSSHSQESGTRHTNSTLNAGNIVLNSKANTNISGANIHGSNSLTYNVGGNLNLSSVQDTHQSSYESIGASIGVSGSGSGISGMNAGYNSAHGSSNSKTTLLTSATGGTVEVNVGGNTDIKGALLSGGSYNKEGEFVANNNLILNTASLTHSDLSNVSHSSDVSVGVNVNVSLGSNTQASTPQNTSPSGTKIDSTHLNYNNTQTHDKSKTLATIGGGSITVANKPYIDTSLNRDTDAIDKEIYHIEENKGNIDLTLDHRVFSEDGRKSIAEDMERVKRLGGALADVATSDAFIASDTLDHIDEVQKDLDVQKAMALEQDGKLIEILDDKNRDKYTIEERDEALNTYAQIYAQTYGVSIDEAKSVATKKYRGLAYTNADKTSSTVYIDDNHNNGALDTAETMGHEITHVRIDQGQARDRKDSKLNEEYANTMGSYSADGLEFTSNTYNNIQLDNTLPTHRKPRNQTDQATLSTNTDGLIVNVNKAKHGDGSVEPMSLADYNILKEQAENGNRGAQETLDDFEQSVVVEKDINDAAVSTIKDPEIYKELSGYNDAVDTVQAILDGDMKEAALLAAGIVLKPVKALKNADDILDAIEKNGGKAIKKDGKIYGKDKNGELVSVEQLSRVKAVNNRMPINSKKYAGRTIPLEDLPKNIRNKYPKSVEFSGSGYPDFTPYAKKKVDIKLTGNRRQDEILANKASGYSKTPDGYTWHHHQESGHMQLIPQDLHDAVKHTGGVATSGIKPYK